MSTSLTLSMLLAACGSPDATGADERFEAWDANNDGRLVVEEVPVQLRGNFARVDLDGDGFISLEEHMKAVGRVQQPDPESRLPQSVLGRFDLPYAGTDNPRQRLDLYTPRNRGDELLPVLVYIHGGGWMVGRHRDGLDRLMSFVEHTGYAGVSVGYRLSGESTWPAQIHDCKAAIRWIRGNAEHHGLDPDRIVVWGTSSGGHLASMLGVSGGVEELEGALGSHLDESSRVRAVIDFYGPAEIASMQGQTPAGCPLDHDAPDSPESRLLGGPVQEMLQEARNASPRSWVSVDDAPILLVHGDADQLVPCLQSVDFHQSLKDAGVDSTLLRVAGGGHGGFRNPMIERTVRDFLRKHLEGRDVEIEGGVIPNEPGETSVQ
ncbi:MAG: alpha/beta hydrolase [Phycisphaerales bacterium]|nr:alpha/beta hydrolase [Phycisphaerales bacterium]